MARELKNHPGMFLNDAAAADFDRLEDENGVFTVNSARRSEAEQQELINRWNRGGVYNRPPYLYEPFRPARLGPHVKNDGIAVDIAQWQRFEKLAPNYNFDKPHKWDVVHFEHNGNRDTLNSEGKPAGNETAPELPEPDETGELSMEWIILVLAAPGQENDNTMVLINMHTKEMINLGNSPHSAVRAYYAENHKWRFISVDEWVFKFGEGSGFNYLYAF